MLLLGRQSSFASEDIRIYNNVSQLDIVTEVVTTQPYTIRWNVGDKTSDDRVTVKLFDQALSDNNRRLKPFFNGLGSGIIARLVPAATSIRVSFHYIGLDNITNSGSASWIPDKALLPRPYRIFLEFDGGSEKYGPEFLLVDKPQKTPNNSTGTDRQDVASPPAAPNFSKNCTRAIVGTVFGTILFCLLVAALIIFFLKFRKRNRIPIGKKRPRSFDTISFAPALPPVPRLESIKIPDSSLFIPTEVESAETGIHPHDYETHEVGSPTENEVLEHSEAEHLGRDVVSWALAERVIF